MNECPIFVELSHEYFLLGHQLPWVSDSPCDDRLYFNSASNAYKLFEALFGN